MSTGWDLYLRTMATNGPIVHPPVDMNVKISTACHFASLLKKHGTEVFQVTSLATKFITKVLHRSMSGTDPSKHTDVWVVILYSRNH
jgi:hypothetical protein